MTKEEEEIVGIVEGVVADASRIAKELLDSNKVATFAEVCQLPSRQISD